MKYDPIMCMMVHDSVKTKDAGGFAPGSKAKIVVEKEGSSYESFTVEYGGSPLKRGFKTREAAKKYAEKQGLIVDCKTADAEFQMYGPEFHHPIIKASSKEEAIRKAKEIYGWGGKVEAVKVSDEKTLDRAIRNCDRDHYEYETIKNDIDIAARGKANYITKSSLQNRITRGFQTNRLTKEEKEELLKMAERVSN